MLTASAVRVADGRRLSRFSQFLTGCSFAGLRFWTLSNILLLLTALDPPPFAVAFTWLVAAGGSTSTRCAASAFVRLDASFSMCICFLAEGVWPYRRFLSERGVAV